MKFYAGIGSRETPADVIKIMIESAKKLAQQGYILRSGRADGADLAFERGAFIGEGRAEIFLPWKSFNEGKGFFETKWTSPPEWTYEVAEVFHPRWQYLKRGAKLLHARNVMQVFGPEIDSPWTEFVLCWTKDGKSGGGTGQAIRIAKLQGIPVYDLAIPEVRMEWED